MQQGGPSTQLSKFKTSFSVNLKDPSFTFMVKGIALDVEEADNFLNYGNVFASAATTASSASSSSSSTGTFKNEVSVPARFTPKAVLLCAQNIPHASIRSADGVCDVCPSEMILKRLEIIPKGAAEEDSSLLRLKHYSWELTHGHHWQVNGPARVGLRLRLLVVDQTDGSAHTVPIVPVAEKGSYAQHPSIVTGDAAAAEKPLPSAVFADISVSINSQCMESESTEKMAADAAEAKAIRKLNNGGDDEEEDEHTKKAKSNIYASPSLAALLTPAPRRDWRLIMHRRWYMIRPEVRQATVRDSFFARHKYEMSAKSLQQALDEEREMRFGGGGGGRRGRDDDEWDSEEEDEEDDEFDSDDEGSYGVYGRSNLKRYRAEAARRKKAIAELREKQAKRKENLAKQAAAAASGKKGAAAAATANGKKKGAAAVVEDSESDADDYEEDDENAPYEALARKFPTLEQRLTWIRLSAKEKYSGSVHEALAVSSCGRFVMWKDGTETPMAEVKLFESTFVPANATSSACAAAGSSSSSSPKLAPSANPSTSTDKDILVYRFPHRNSDVIGAIPFGTESTAIGMATNKFTGEVFVCWKQLFKPHEYVVAANTTNASVASGNNAAASASLAQSLVASLSGTPNTKETYRTHPSFTVGAPISLFANDGEAEEKKSAAAKKGGKAAARTAGKKAPRDEEDECPALIEVLPEDALSASGSTTANVASPDASISAAPIEAEGILGWSVLKGFSAADIDALAAATNSNSKSDAANGKKKGDATKKSGKKGSSEAKESSSSGAASGVLTASSTVPQPTFFLVEKKLDGCHVFPSSRYFSSSRTDRGVRIRAEPNLHSKQVGIMDANEVKEAVAVHVDKKGNVFIEWKEMTSSPGYEDAAISPVPNTCDNATAVSYSVIQARKKAASDAATAAASAAASPLSTRAPTDVNFNGTTTANSTNTAEPQPATPNTATPTTAAASPQPQQMVHTFSSIPVAAPNGAASSPCTLASAKAKRSNGGYSLAKGPQGVAGGTFLVEVFPFRRALAPLNFEEIIEQSAAANAGAGGAASSSSDDDDDAKPASKKAGGSKKKGNANNSDDDEIIDLDREKERKRRAADFVNSLNRSKAELIKDPTASKHGKASGGKNISDADFQSGSEDFSDDEGFEPDWNSDDDDDEEDETFFGAGEEEDEEGDYFGGEEEEGEEFEEDFDEGDDWESEEDDDFYAGDEEDEEDWFDGDDDEEDVFAPAPTGKKSASSAVKAPEPTKKKGTAVAPAAATTKKADAKATTAASASKKKSDKEADLSKKATVSAAFAAASNTKKGKKGKVQEPSDDDSIFNSDFGSDDYDKAGMDDGSFVGSDDADQYASSEADDSD